MIKSFEELIDICKKSVELDPWSSERSIEGYGKELIEEAEEVRKAIENNDLDNLREEVGDVLWDLISLSLIAEKKGLFTLKDVFNDISEKIKRRKPYLLENKSVTKEASRLVWRKAKEIEKRDKSKRKPVKIYESKDLLRIDE